MSGSTVAGDKIPIRTTHAALIWNSVKTGKLEIKEFTIRNTSNNKIKIQAVILDSEQNFRVIFFIHCIMFIILQTALIETFFSYFSNSFSFFESDKPLVRR